MEKENIKMKSREEFVLMVDDLVEHYTQCDDMWEYLEGEGMTREEVLTINPLDIVREISKLNNLGKLLVKEGEDKNDTVTHFTDRMSILIGLCDFVTHVNRPPYGGKFKCHDLIMTKENNMTKTLVVMDCDNFGYFVDDMGSGDGYYLTFEQCEEVKARKIGEVTKDVFDELLNKRKGEVK